jgi:predicted DNA-binding transcriptional regulator YafY
MKTEMRSHHRPDMQIAKLHYLISLGGYPSAKRMAEELEVSRRTVMRYLDVLRERGAPLNHDRRRNGYYFNDPFWQLPPTKMTEGDLLAFFIAEQSLRFTGHNEYAEQLRKSLGRLTALLPDHISVSLSALGSGMSFQAMPFAAVEPKLLEFVALSAIEQQTIEFDYYSPHNRQTTHRVADVHWLHNFAGDWYAVSFDPEKREFRDFHIGRMSNVKATPRFFERQKNWRAEDHLKSGFYMMRGGRTTSVEILFDAYQAQWIRERHFFHPDEQREDLPDGSLRLSFKIGEQGLEAVARFCLTYSGHCRVEKPGKLKELVREKLKKGLDLHQ